MPGYVTKDQLARAREIDVLDYVLRYESSNVRRVGSGYRMKDHPSIEVKPGKWRWYSQGLYGRTALDYLTDVRGYGLVEAVCMLLGEEPALRSIEPKARPPTPKKPEAPPLPQPSFPTEERKPFTLPIRNTDNNRVLDYLQGRGIDRQIILDCIERGLLYENAHYHNCVFVGRDERGKARFATMRGTSGDFKCDAEGSDKSYGFTLPPNNPDSRKIAIFEAPIDCLSHQTLCKQGLLEPFDGWRISLGGTSLNALTRFLESHPDVNHCVVCTDNDEAGNKAAAEIAELSGVTIARSPPMRGKDWNDTLSSIRNEVNLLEDKRKDILFLNEPFTYPEKFRIKDGDSVKVTFAYDGEVNIQKCRFIDETHLTVGSSTYHISELAERLKKNGNKIEPIPDQKPMLNILAAKYGEPLQDVEVPMTDAAIKKLVGGKYISEDVRGDHVLLRGKDGAAVCKREDFALTTVHPYWAQTLKREIGTIEPPPVAPKRSLHEKLDSAKGKAAEQITAKAGDLPQKRAAAELG